MYSRTSDSGTGIEEYITLVEYMIITNFNIFSTRFLNSSSKRLNSYLLHKNILINFITCCVKVINMFYILLIFEA